MLHYPSDDGRGEGVDLLTNTALLLPDEFVKEVEVALEKSCEWNGCLLPATTDADFEIPIYKNDSSEPQVWNNPDIYGGTSGKKSSEKCIAQ